ncbi:MAG: DUF1127 domain-containing protein [Aeromonadaceae bacterium]
MATQLNSHTSTLQPAGIVEHLKSMCVTWFERARSRRELAELPPYLLKDIGLTEADRFNESNKPFWRD